MGNVDSEFPELKRSVSVYCGDANEKLEQIIHEQDWRYNRGLLFLDPYATQVNWTTLETVAQTKSIDVWYLFRFLPLSGCCRRMGNTKNGRTALTGCSVIPDGVRSFIRKIHR